MKRWVNSSESVLILKDLGYPWKNNFDRVGTLY